MLVIAEKVEQLEDSLATRGQLSHLAAVLYTGMSQMKTSPKLWLWSAMLIGKHGKPFTEGEFVRDCVMKTGEHICPKKMKDFSNICLTRNTVVQRIEEITRMLLYI